MDINNLDVIQTRDSLQNHIKSESTVTFQGVNVMKMNFKDLFTIIENEEGKRIFLPKDQTEFKRLVEQIEVDGQPLQIIYSENPLRPDYGICSVCNGTGVVDSNPCTNCGGQYQSGVGKGVVLLNDTGNPCVHNYWSETIRSTYTQFRCESCGDSYQKNL